MQYNNGVNNNTNNNFNISNNVQTSWFLDMIIGLFFGVMSTVLMAIQLVAIKIVSKSNLDEDEHIVYLCIINIILGSINNLLFEGFSKFFSSIMIVFLCTVNALIILVATKLVQMSYKGIDMGKLTAIGYSQVVFAFIFGVLFLHESVLFTDVVGALVIFGYNLYDAYYRPKDEDE